MPNLIFWSKTHNSCVQTKFFYENVIHRKSGEIHDAFINPCFWTPTLKHKFFWGVVLGCRAAAVCCRQASSWPLDSYFLCVVVFTWLFYFYVGFS